MPKKTSAAKTSVRKITATHGKKRAAASLLRRRVFGLKLHHASGIGLLVAAALAWAIFMLATQPAGTGNAADCAPDAKMVNPCRPWFGAAVGGYNTGGKTQFQFFNMRLNNANVLTNTGLSVTQTYKMDFPHIYHAPGQNLFSNGAREALNDSSLYGHSSKPILINWKPGGSSWGATAKGQNDSSIIEAAKQVKSLGSRKIMLALWHEPENDNVNAQGLTVTGSCKTPSGSNGSAAEYRAMWRRVHDVFKQQGVTNVVWVWNPMGFVGDGNDGWACIENALYPGDDIVDWIMWDPYSSGSGDFDGSVGKFYNFLNQNSNSSHNYKSKPWGLAEFGSNSDPAKAIGYWQEGIKTIGTKWSENKFPNIKLYAVFDTSSNGGVNGGLRIGYNNAGAIDTKEQAAFNEFAKNILKFGDGSNTTPTPAPTPMPTKDTVPPTVTIDGPANNATVRGTITIKGTAKDNVKVKAVTLRVNDKWIATDGSSPYSFTLDTSKYPNGKHEIVLRAWDPTDNMGQSPAITLNFQNGSKAPAPADKAPSRSTTTITAVTSSDSSSGISVRGTIVVSPTAPGNSIQIWIDGKLQPNNTIDSSWLTNGTHAIKIVENGAESLKLVSVNNPMPLAALNEVRANPAQYGAVAGALLAITVFWIVKPYIFGLTSSRERSLTRAQRRIK